LQVLNIIAVALALIFLVPGYIIHSIITSFIPRRQDDTQLLALRFLTYSALNAFVCKTFIIEVKDSYPRHIYNTTTSINAALILFIIPVLIGTTISYCEDRMIAQRLFSIIKLSQLHQSPSAWETRFKSLSSKNYAYVLVTFKDGKQVFGYHGDASIASSDSKERDIYLQRTYVRNEQGTFASSDDNGGIWIKGDEIRSIEFTRASPAIPDGQNKLIVYGRLFFNRVKYFLLEE
jgi:hypothetical protein